MRRREFVSLLGGAAAAAWPMAARAQQDGRVRRVGVLIRLPADDAEVQAWMTAFRQGLEKRGWSDGRNVHVDYRFVPVISAEQFQAPLRELVALQPDVMLAHGTPATAAMQRASRTIPIVFVAVSDPIGSGLVASLAHPGGNVTGFLQYEDGIVGKWVAMLKEIAPELTSVAIMASKVSPFDYFLHAAAAVAPSLNVKLVPSPIETATDIERAIEAAAVPGAGLLVSPDTTNIQYRDLIVALAARNRVPAVYPFRTFVAAGGLMSYGIDRVEVYRQAASYVDRILRGEKPTDLPVQAPTKYETVLNLKTAKDMGLVVPDLMIVRADEVIE